VAGGVGVLAARLLMPHIALAMAVSLGLNLLLLQRLRMWLPPLLAAGLLPFLIPDVDGRYVLGITISAAVLALSSPLTRSQLWGQAPSSRNR
jgi:hypothetical protein